VEGQWFPIGFMIGRKGSPFFRKVWDLQQAAIRGSARRAYQGFGTHLYKTARQAAVSDESFSIHPREVYQHRWAAHRHIFAGKVNREIGIGIHWYGGSDSAAEHEPKMTHENWRDHPMATVMGVTL
jgi:hypothetical protein